MLPLTIIFAALFYTAHSARILGYFFFPSISHQVMHQAIWKELSLRGHEVTVLTASPLKDPNLTNLTEIDLNFSYEMFHRENVAEKMSKDYSVLSTILFYMDHLGKIIAAQLQTEQVQELLRDDTKDFDLILVESLHPLVYGIAAKYDKVPIVGVSSLGVMLNSHDALGNPTHPVLHPDFWLNFDGPMSLYDRAYSAFYNIWFRWLYYWHIQPKFDQTARNILGENMPYLGDLEKSTSLILLNSNPIFHPIRPNVPAIIELGQMHLNVKNPLPKDLQTYLDESTQGVIYFSLGNIVKSANLTENVRNVICQALSELPYNVLWKWESDDLPGKPKNVMVRKWLPQQDVLGHKNIKAFVTQGGLQSMEEAVTNGVPLVGMPFFVDQPQNVQKMVEIGIAGGPVNFRTMTKDELKAVIMEVAENQKYKKRCEEIRNLLQDQPMRGVEKAVWWIEYVIRHNGAKHLKSPAGDMPWYQYSLFDVYVLFWLVTALCIYLPIKALRRK